MADANRIELHGTEELYAGSRVLVKRIGDTSEQRFDGVASKVADTVRGTVPYLSGAMAASVFSEPIGDGSQVGYDGSARYAGWVDFGGTRGRDWVPEGRYLYPVVGRAEPLLEAAAQRSAIDEIRSMQWPKAR